MDPSPVEVLGSIVEERAMPWPLVYYPPHYGTFIVFGRGDGAWMLCACTEPGVANYLRLRERMEEATYADPLRMSALATPVFPDPFARAALTATPSTVLRFAHRVCHRCNLTPPSRRWCHEMYGGRFEQGFGWYIRQAHLAVGVQGRFYLDDVTPESLQVLLRALVDAQREYQKENSRVDALKAVALHSWNLTEAEAEAEPWVAARKKVERLQREIHNKLENIARADFGIRDVGDRWVSETLLFQIVRRLLPNEEIMRHHRPEWLHGLELDIYIPGQRLGIEYQGQQHFHAVEAWGGEDALDDLRERDARKEKLCAASAVRLVTVDYTEPLTMEHIRSVLDLARSTPA